MLRTNSVSLFDKLLKMKCLNSKIFQSFYCICVGFHQSPQNKQLDFVFKDLVCSQKPALFKDVSQQMLVVVFCHLRPIYQSYPQKSSSSGRLLVLLECFEMLVNNYKHMLFNFAEDQNSNTLWWRPKTSSRQVLNVVVQ